MSAAPSASAATSPMAHHSLASRAAGRWQRLDARGFQIAFLSSFLLLGALARDFAISPLQVLLALVSALVTQAAWLWALDLPGKSRWSGYLSALVSSLGLCILVRSETLWAHPLLAVLAMGSKFVLRAGPANCRSHVFNPVNLAAFVAWAWLPGAWLSPGQWGSSSLAALWFIGLGGLVTQRISRWDVSGVFLLAWGGLLAGRLAWLGHAWDAGAAIWLQQVGNGAVLLFAFFMISDPMTTPQDRRARMGYAATVALLAFLWQFVLYRPHGLIVALCAASLAVPLINRLWPRTRFEWAGPPQVLPGGCR